MALGEPGEERRELRSAGGMQIEERPSLAEHQIGKHAARKLNRGTVD
jgi:hypothetical protein